MILPDGAAALCKKAQEIVEICNTSKGARQSIARSQHIWINTGRDNGMRSTVNKLYAHCDRLASHLYSPSELRFTIDFENHYPKNILNQADMASRVLTREWERHDIDMNFGAGVFVGTCYGAAIMKQTMTKSGVDSHIVMPWNFGVYNEARNGLGIQEAMCETIYLTPPEVWRRISHLPDATALYKRIMSHGDTGDGNGGPDGFFHQVLSTSQLNASDAGNPRTAPGGIVGLSSDPSYATVMPQVGVPLIKMFELWVVDEAARDGEGDYTTIQIISPDILIAPIFQRKNLFAPETTPYTLIQPNHIPGNFWGRSEIVDLIEPQAALTTTSDDIKRTLGQMFDKLLAFTGVEGMTDEMYAQFRGAGYMALGPGAGVEDLTPKVPQESFEYIKFLEQSMEEVAGFGNILSGQGESGVRAGVHADTLMRAASPRLRDRSLLIERQCADAGDKTLDLLEAKDGKTYWTEEGPDKSEFLLAQLPDDRRVSVDSHSSSPIYAEDHQNLISFGFKAGVVDGESVIDLLPFPSKDILRARYRQAQEAKQKLIAEHPELLTQGHKGGKK